ncbi:MAG: DNA primase [Nitrososphaerales archaeon]
MSKIQFGRGDLAKYPFLSEAGNYLKELDYSLDEFDDPSKKRVIDRAVERIGAALDGQVFKQLEDLDTEVVSFLIALIMVRALGMRNVSRKYSLGEARRAEMFLEQDLKHENKEQIRSAVLKRIFNDLFALKVEQQDSRFKVKVSEYLKRAAYFHDDHWKLVNRVVHNGYVYLKPDETVRLIRDELTIFIYERINKMEIRQLPDSIKSEVKELRSKVSKHSEFRRYVVTTKYPPCIQHVLQSLSRGENPPHSARFLLATYMLSIGRSTDEVSAFFETAPDYNERVTRYQVEHLAGIRGSRTKYTCPSCDKAASQNLCYRTEECNGIINPVQFGKRRVWKGEGAKSGST